MASVPVISGLISLTAVNFVLSLSICTTKRTNEPTVSDDMEAPGDKENKKKTKFFSFQPSDGCIDSNQGCTKRYWGDRFTITKDDKYKLAVPAVSF